MAVVDYKVWLPEVLPDVPGCPDPLAVNAIRNACIEFCTETCWWQVDFGPTSLTAALLPYSFTTTPTGTDVAQIMVATLNGLPLAITNQDELDNKIVGWRTATGQPRAFFQPIPGAIDLYPRPAGTDSYSIYTRLALTPVRASVNVNADIQEAYQEEIAAGALSRLLAMPNRPWWNSQAADYYGKVFDAGKKQASIERTKSYGRGQLQVQMRSV